MHERFVIAGKTRNTHMFIQEIQQFIQEISYNISEINRQKIFSLIDHGIQKIISNLAYAKNDKTILSFCASNFLLYVPCSILFECLGIHTRYIAVTLINILTVVYWILARYITSVRPLTSTALLHLGMIGAYFFLSIQSCPWRADSYAQSNEIYSRGTLNSSSSWNFSCFHIFDTEKRSAFLTPIAEMHKTFELANVRNFQIVRS